MDFEFAYIIPSFNPDQNLIELVRKLSNKSFYPIFVIDDGSRQEHQSIFCDLSKFKNVILLRHAVNLGKGAALKTAFNYILTKKPEIKGVVTLDSDGQHTIEDCKNIIELLKKHPNNFLLGYRSFNTNIPLKSYIGNNISRFIYTLVLGKNFKDTQTGLRGFGIDVMKKCLTINSNRFEFETEQLALVLENDIPIYEIPIKTIYIENNKSTSFKPLADSFRIYFTLVKYGLSSFTTAIVDFVVFYISIYFGKNVIFSNYLARTFSIFVQFFLLDNFVFKSKTKLLRFLHFSTYVYIMGTVSALTQLKFLKISHSPILLIKVTVEFIMFFVNFFMLRLFVFKRK